MMTIVAWGIIGLFFVFAFTNVGDLFRWKLVPQRRADGMMDYDAPPIMERLHVLRTPWFECAFHRLLNPDNMKLGYHDHPWHFWSIVVWGWYVERYIDPFFLKYPPPGRVVPIPRERRRGLFSRARHSAEYTHAIVEVSARGCVTFVVTGRRVRKWGFPEKGIVIG